MRTGDRSRENLSRKERCCGANNPSEHTLQLPLNRRQTYQSLDQALERVRCHESHFHRQNQLPELFLSAFRSL